MNKRIKITHRTVEVDEGEIQYFLVLTEYCSQTKRIIGTYLLRLPEWVAENPDEDYGYYQPMLN